MVHQSGDRGTASQQPPGKEGMWAHTGGGRNAKHLDEETRYYGGPPAAKLNGFRAISQDIQRGAHGGAVRMIRKLFVGQEGQMVPVEVAVQ
jgi:hypothetical protein